MNKQNKKIFWVSICLRYWSNSFEFFIQHETMKLWGVRFCVCGLMVHQSAQQLSCSKNDRCREGPHFSTQISCRNSASADFEKKKLYVVHNCLAHCLPYISRHSDNTSKGVKKQRLISIELLKKSVPQQIFFS